MFCKREPIGGHRQPKNVHFLAKFQAVCYRDVYNADISSEGD